MKEIDSMIYYIAQTELEKRLQKQLKKIEKVSERLKAHDPFKGTQRQGAMLRVKLTAECEERDRIQKHIDRCKELRRNNLNEQA